jgi:bifunctional non-homologous end joining protein LigD
MASKLERYRRKRDFDATPEPSGDAGVGGARAPRFVVQEHSARRLHWDLRLEHEGVAASWAVPNGIPDVPDENRKAVHTEDHPLEYLEFEGEIPKGSYGAGTMRVWDSGTYELHKWEPRKVIVTFHGDRISGRYALFQAGRDDKDWLIHRMDPPADPARQPLPVSVVPMLARAGELPRDQERYGFEVKWDGIRAIAYLEPGRLRLQGRRLNDITSQYPDVHDLVRALGAHDAILDGEIVAFDDTGRPSFERLQQRMHLGSEAQVRRRAKQVPATYIIFDLLHLDGRSLMGLPYQERRAKLEQLDLNGHSWRTPRYYRGEGSQLFGAAEQQGLEGVVAKRLDSPYEPGRRSGAWVKVKAKRSLELVVAGWFPGEGRRRETIGALLLGYYDPDGRLHYAGRAGSGFSDSELEYLKQQLAPLTRRTSPFTGKAAPKGSRYVEPELVAEVEFTDWTAEMILRHPVYKGLRKLDPREVVIGGEAGGEDGEALAGETPKSADSLIGPLRPLPKGGMEATIDGRTLRLSNLDKVLYPQAGFTKGDLIDYYARVSPALLPHLRGRPLTLKRYPDGVEGQYFYEKQCPSHRPDWVRTHPVWSRHNGRNIDFCIADDLPTLVWAANLADIELHTSMSLAEEIERPTMMVFDLDPGPPADVVHCCEVALWLRELLDPLGLATFPKTSGSKGLQLYVPLNTDAGYDNTKPFARAVAELLEKHHPDRVVSRMTKQLRPGKVLVDWSQNDEHKTTVCVYSLRAKPRPTVSTPLAWDEVEACLRGGDAAALVFEPADVLRRVERDGDLFAETLTRTQAMPRL